MRRENPDNTRLEANAAGGLRAKVRKEEYAGIFVACALPARRPDGYLSLRYADADGREHEVGLVRDLRDWTAGERALLEQARARRYFIRAITGIAGRYTWFDLAKCPTVPTTTAMASLR